MFRLSSPARAREVRFGLCFFAIASILFFAYCFPYEDGGAIKAWFSAYLDAYAGMAGRVLALFDRSVTVSGEVIHGRYPLRIIKTCDAIEAKILLAAAILSYPARWWWRISAALAGVAILFWANVLRICSLYYVGIYLPTSFEFAHVQVWPALLVALAVGLFIGWASWVRNIEARHVS